MRPNFFFDGPQTDWEILNLSLEDFIKMCEWAFGPNWQYWPQLSLPKLWNKRHSKIFLISGTDEKGNTMMKIRDAWMAKELYDHTK